MNSTFAAGEKMAWISDVVEDRGKSALSRRIVAVAALVTRVDYWNSAQEHGASLELAVSLMACHSASAELVPVPAFAAN